MIASLEQVARLLQAQGVRFIVIGGWAAIIQASKKARQKLAASTLAPTLK
jgi:anthranilate phosphoribosyltransferase